MAKKNDGKKAFLNSYLEARLEALEVSEELNSLYTSALPSGISYGGVGSGSPVPHGLEAVFSRIDEVSRRLSGRIDASVQVREEVARCIDALPQDAERKVMRMRYLSLRERKVRGRVVGYCHKSFGDIAEALNYSYRYVLEVHGRALEDLVVPNLSEKS